MLTIVIICADNHVVLRKQACQRRCQMRPEKKNTILISVEGGAIGRTGPQPQGLPKLGLLFRQTLVPFSPEPLGKESLKVMGLVALPMCCRIEGCTTPTIPWGISLPVVSAEGSFLFFSVAFLRSGDWDRTSWWLFSLCPSVPLSCRIPIEVIPEPVSWALHRSISTRGVPNHRVRCL